MKKGGITGFLSFRDRSENEMEEQHVQEEKQENEQSETTGASETSKSEETAETTEQAGESGDRQQADVPPAGTEGRETGTDAGIETSQQPEVEISREPLSEEDSSPSAQPSTDYNGKIVSGDELVEVVGVLQKKGIKSYIITRENGEGYFSSAQIREKCDPACSFLVSVSGSEAKLIEQ